MIGGIDFYNKLFQKYVILFGVLFDNIKIDRVLPDGTLEEQFKVPIAYGPREKFLARVTENPTGIAQAAIRLPRMAFSISNIQYAANRKLPTGGKILSVKNINGNNVYKNTHNPVPYDIGFKLQILSKTMEDGLRIVEQILPYFTPEYTVSAMLLGNDFDNKTDIPLVLDDVSIEDQYEEKFEDRKVLTLTLDFTMKCYFYGPVVESKVIKFVDVNLYTDTANTDFTNVSSIDVRPGLTANGQPTTNIANTVPYSQIEESDNYAYIVTIEDYFQ